MTSNILSSMVEYKWNHSFLNTGNNWQELFDKIISAWLKQNMPSGRRNRKKKIRLNGVNEATFKAQIVRVGIAVAVIKKKQTKKPKELTQKDICILDWKHSAWGKNSKKAKKADEKVPQHPN